MDILARIDAYDCSDGGHSDTAEGSAYDLMGDAVEEIKYLRNQLERIENCLKTNDLPRHAIATIANQARMPTK